MGFIKRQTFRTKTQAKNWIQKTETAIRDGRYKNQSAARVHDVNDMIDRFLREAIPHQHRYFHQKVQLLSKWKKEIGEVLLCQLSASHIAAIRDKLLVEVTIKDKLRTSSTVNRYLSGTVKEKNSACSKS